MRYSEFRDVMLAKGYSIVDVMDCIRDFLRSDAAPGWITCSFNQFVALYVDHIYDRFVRLKKQYDVDVAFGKLMADYDLTHNFYKDRPADDIFDDICSDVWDHCHFGHHQLDSYWLDLLKDC